MSVLTRDPARRRPLLHTSYRSDMALLNTRAKRYAVVVLLLLAASLPFLLSDSDLNLLVGGSAYAIGAIGLMLLTGYAGQISLGHAFFAGVGFYTAAVISGDPDGRSLGFGVTEILIWLPAAGLAAAVVGAVVAPLATRLRGLYLAIVTLGLVFVGEHLFAQWESVTGWSVVGAGLPPSNVPSIAVSGDELYAGVAFQGVWKWDGTSWFSLGGPGGTVNSLSVQGDDVYAGGAFTGAGGTPANFIARWDGTRWHPLGGGTSSNVFATAVRGGDVFAGGFFPQAGGVRVNGVAGWDGEAWSALGSGIGTGSGGVNELAVSGDQVYAAGSFLTAGLLPANRLAAWRDPDLIGVGRDVASGGGLVEFRDLFTTTAVALSVEAGAGAGFVNAYRYDQPPADPVGVVGEVSGYRWVLHQQGLATPFHGQVRFALPEIPEHGVTDPSRVTVYARPTPGRGRFAPLPTSYDPGTGTLQAQATALGEFAFGIGPADTRPAGELTGTVSAVDCQGDRAPLAGAVVQVEGSGSEPVTLRTDRAGGYRWWLATDQNPLTLIVVQDGYWWQTRATTVSPQHPAREDFTLPAICPTESSG